MTTTTNKTTGRPTPFEIEDSIEFGERFDELAGPYDGEAGPCVARGALSVAEDRDSSRESGSPKGERARIIQRMQTPAVAEAVADLVRARRAFLDAAVRVRGELCEKKNWMACVEAAGIECRERVGGDVELVVTVRMASSGIGGGR